LNLRRSTRNQGYAAALSAPNSSGAYAGPVYGCRYVERHDRWGNIRLIKVCDVY
jgi:hypothetical protein